MKPLDLLLVNPGNRIEIYQGLGHTLSAIEPPLWTGLLATHARARGFSVAIVDGEAEDLTPQQIAERVAALAPRLVTVVIFGHQPSASTQNMAAGGRVCRAIKEHTPAQKVLIVGGHPSALPERTLREEAADYVCEGEGPRTIEALLHALEATSPDLSRVPGLWYRDGEVRSTPRAGLISDLDAELPGVAWDLLPMDRYRAHNWHCFGHVERRSPYASIYTSLGCPYRCTFCCINAPFGQPLYRVRSPDLVVNELAHLAEKYGVRNVKIVDEMFVLKLSHVTAICEKIIQRGLDLNIWAYARIDTVKPHILDTLRRAGVRWLALGIESGSEHVRDGADKSFGKHDIAAVVKTIRDAGIYVIGNYIFGLPDDTLETMQETLDLAQELNCEMANFYSAMAYPGSPLYRMAVEEGWALPDSWDGFSQHSVNTLPLPTRFVSAAEVLRFRDRAFTTYFSNPQYLDMVAATFGADTARHIREMAERPLVRKHA